MKKLLLSALLASALSFSQEVKNDTIQPSKTLNDYLYSVDKFNGDKVYYSPYAKNISIARYTTKKSGTSQYIDIDVIGITLNYGCKGLSILFENGMKINRPNEVVETSYNDGYQYSVWFKPTAKEIAMFKKYKITDVKLYIYEEQISDEEAVVFKESAKVMLTVPNIKKK
jgi:hypothetical protein